MVLRGSSYLCIQGSLLVELTSPYEMLEIVPGPAANRANTLSTVLSSHFGGHLRLGSPGVGEDGEQP